MSSPRPSTFSKTFFFFSSNGGGSSHGEEEGRRTSLSSEPECFSARKGFIDYFNRKEPKTRTRTLFTAVGLAPSPQSWSPDGRGVALPVKGPCGASQRPGTATVSRKPYADNEGTQKFSIRMHHPVLKTTDSPTTDKNQAYLVNSSVPLGQRVLQLDQMTRRRFNI